MPESSNGGWLRSFIERRKLTEKKAICSFSLGAAALAANWFYNSHYPQHETTGIVIADSIEVGTGIVIVASAVILNHFEKRREAAETPMPTHGSSSSTESDNTADEILADLNAMWRLPAVMPPGHRPSSDSE